MKRIFLPAIIFILALLAVEPIKLIVGPVYLVNEYPEISSVTRLETGDIKNSDILKFHGNDSLIRKFVSANKFEYVFQVSGRGPINHVGQVLNPLNEYLCGKPVSDTYMQYGLGYTFLVKWVMDLFGGVSLDNFYKSQIWYVIYSLLFLLMLSIIFRDVVYIFIGILGLAISHFMNAYCVFYFAPGIIPIIHGFDPLVLISFFFILRGKRELLWACVAAGLCFSAVFLNQRFGIFLVMSSISAAVLYVLENKTGKARGWWLVGCAGTLFLSLYLYSWISGISAGGTAGFFLSGFFSWRPSKYVVAATLLYLPLSYIFLALIKDKRCVMKYVYVLVFAYSQCLLLYYYWSGLKNHLPMALPFLLLQAAIALFICEREAPDGKEEFKRGIAVFKYSYAIVLFFVLLAGLRYFYAGKKEFTENFSNHKTYAWAFKKAKLISTIDPANFSADIGLLEKYSASEKGIYILSQYDNLLPFLADRFSVFPSFELEWWLSTPARTQQVIGQVQKAKPLYLFVDNTIVTPRTITQSSLFPEESFGGERNSSAGRVQELGKVFAALSPKYVLVEKGFLLSVYKKRE